ncbi:type VII secretion integral membrane protein EccD [Actinoplanes palleronii]|uniref:EccD-like transmembrane domain-containing protein n=1 Tax=Actinoplanes palleronii TaxID=113570 RepID=A0ABQ4BFX7_9ACTN|nr:type VII secretion integral membrane protein EccD [Actinoplanes palleronii]GIE69590.1 hypothetical protein Apa02nite_056980 [Actinoplanes palleronii]
MTAAMSGEICRITVTGPDRQVDLAVPVGIPVADLLPQLLQLTSSGPGFERDLPEGPWVLQRLGAVPFELSGTPESLDWIEGEQLYLRRAEDPLPELDFDDLAEGVATMVNRRTDRWQAEHRRPLFLVLSAIVMLVVARAVVAHGPLLPQIVSGAVLSLALLAAALVSARRLTDGNFALLFGCGAVFFAAIAASSAVDDKLDGVAWTGPAVLAGAVAATAVSALLLVFQRTVTPHMPFAPMLFVGLTALTVVLTILLGDAAGASAATTSAAASAVLFAVIVLAPRFAVKLSRLRGPQLPKTGEDMAYDIEPDDSSLVKERADNAETYLTVAIVVAAVLLPVLFHFVNQVSGWSGWTLVLLVSSAVLLRSRTFFGLWQRLALVAAGVAGYVLVLLRLADSMPSGGRFTLIGVLLVLLIPLVLAALRPWPQRMLPFWEYSATFFDVASGVAILPILAQTLGLYAWARGLFG